MVMRPDFLFEAKNLFEYTRQLRRDFHRHPELGFHEFRTAGVVAAELKKLGLEVITGIAQTGVMGLLEGEHPGPVLLLRFDMDALPIIEETGADYASCNSGVMHACGHDGHTAIGLTVARLLHTHRHELSGTVKLIFQPAEEGLGGAEGMINEGILENPKPDKALALHLWNEKPVGWIGSTPGPTMAASEIFTIHVHGRGGHGALPHLAQDPVLASAHIITALQSVISRDISPLQTAVISVTAIHGGETFNVIPSSVKLQGTIRTFDPVVRQQIIQRFDEITVNVSAGMGCRAEVEITSLTPAVINDPFITEKVISAAEELLPDHHLDTQFITMGSEDMAYILQEIPGCYFFVGSANADKGFSAPHHHPKFDIDESALPIASALMTNAAYSLLS